MMFLMEYYYACFNRRPVISFIFEVYYNEIAEENLHLLPCHYTPTCVGALRNRQCTCKRSAC